MKTIVSAFAALLFACSPLLAQSLEADMRTAAGAYERKDIATAVRIWKVWAGKGNSEARTLLCAMYWSGEGVPRDHKEAARLYLQAANQGYARAQNNIGFMLGFGEGVPPPDDIEAYKWLSLAIAGYTAKNQDRLLARQAHDSGTNHRGGAAGQGFQACSLKHNASRWNHLDASCPVSKGRQRAQMRSAVPKPRSHPLVT